MSNYILAPHFKDRLLNDLLWQSFNDREDWLRAWGKKVLAPASAFINFNQPRDRFEKKIH